MTTTLATTLFRAAARSRAPLLIRGLSDRALEVAQRFLLVDVALRLAEGERASRA